MPRKKLLHFEELTSMPHVFEYPEGITIPWAHYFGNSNPITLEIGCGTGAYTLGLARMFPERNFVGIDVKGARMWHGAKAAEDENLKNIAFLRTRVEQLETFFAPGEISEIWITFPDPQPRLGKARKRLTSTRFLNLYQNILKTDSVVHLKTDNPPLFDFSVDTVKATNRPIVFMTNDLYKELFDAEELHIKTQYEAKYLEMGLPICYLKFKIQPE